jgi:hypothetical protein
MSCLQCQKRLWLELYRPELAEDSAATKAIFAMGHAVGDVARSIYDPKSTGTTIDLTTLGVTKALARTVELVKERKPIFEAGFSANGAMAFADVLLPVRRKEKPVWRMVEVKASTSVKDYHRNDVAVQAYVARRSGLPLAELAIAHIDSTWTYPGDGDYSGLLTEVDLTEEAFGREREVESWIADAQSVATKSEEPVLKIADHCHDPFDCSFIGYCTSLVPRPDYPADWFPRKTAALKKLIYEKGLVDMREVPDEALNGPQLRVKTHTLNATTYFNASGAAADLKPHGFPAFFLDFETISFAVPIWKGTRPYQQIPFQFSLHRLTKAGGLEDQSFLDISGSDPSQRLAEALVGACEDGGPIFVYNAAFESRVIRELAGRFPKLRLPLMKIVERMVDLLPMAQKHYYHPDMHGSWSIKAVLPTIAPDLAYDNLEGVQDGGMAQAAFVEAIRPSTSQSRRDEIKSELLDYCCRDTYAMVRIWQHFAGRQDWKL